MGTDEINVEIEDCEHVDLHLDNLLLVVCFVTHVDVILDQWWPDLLVLAGDEHGRNTNELEVLLANYDFFEIPIDHIDAEKQALSFEIELQMDLNDPVD